MYASTRYQSIWDITNINNDSATTKTLENSPVAMFLKLREKCERYSFKL